jgi:dihydroorotate dehydrogenase (NAD+) catalytic subunit
MPAPGLIRTFGRAWCASGALNFFGEGWPQHRWWGPLRPRWDWATLVTKTATLDPREGHMPLWGTTPVEWFPRCIRANFRRAALLNAVGLSNPGLDNLLVDGRWQEHPRPFVLSFASTAVDRDDYCLDCSAVADRLAEALPDFCSHVAIECNVTCSNVAHGGEGWRTRAADMFDAFEGLRVPLVVKLSASVPPDIVAEIADHRACAGISGSNTILYGSFPDRIPWADLFGRPSPLLALGGGALSGDPLRPLALDWIAACRKAGVTKPIVGGGGILRRAHVREFFAAGADAVSIGSVAALRPWRVAGLIDTARSYDDRDGIAISR